MDVKVLKEFTGYPDGVKTRGKVYRKGNATIPDAYVKEAKLIEKGLVKKGHEKDTKDSAA